jgi:hypothetical protein
MEGGGVLFRPPLAPVASLAIAVRQNWARLYSGLLTPTTFLPVQEVLALYFLFVLVFCTQNALSSAQFSRYSTKDHLTVFLKIE